MQKHEHNFRHNAIFSGVTLKGIMLEHNFSDPNLNAWDRLPPCLLDIPRLRRAFCVKASGVISIKINKAILCNFMLIKENSSKEPF